MDNDQTRELEQSVSLALASKTRKDHNWLRSLRAGTAFVLLDAALGRRSPHLSPQLIEYARALHRRQRQRQGGRVGMRLDRPAHEPWVNAELATVAHLHLGATRVDQDDDWFREVALDVRRSDVPTHRLWPFSEQLGVAMPGGKTTHPIAGGWEQLMDECVHALRSHGLAAENIPAALIGPELGDLWSLRWPEGLARSALLRSKLDGTTLTESVRNLGHHFTHVTQIKKILAASPTSLQRGATMAGVNGLLSAPVTDYDAVRAYQAQIKRVPAHVMHRLRLDPPSSLTLSEGEVAAAWLYCASTSSYLTTVPFLDGRATRSIAGAIADWSRRQSGELIGLIDWNVDSMREQPRDARSTPAEAKAQLA